MTSSRRRNSRASGEDADRPGSTDEGHFVTWPRAALIEGSASGALPWTLERALLTLAVPLVLLLGLGTWWGIRHIENQLEESAPVLLADRGVDASRLTFAADYRNLEVGGTLPAGVVAGDIERILEESVWPGGEEVRNVSITALLPQQQLGPVNVTVTSDGATLVLTGNVPSDRHRDSLLAAAESTGLAIIDNLAVSGLEPSSEDADGQVRAMQRIVAVLDGDVESADLSVDDDGPVFGTVRAADGVTEDELRRLGPQLAVSSPDPLGNLDVLATFDGSRIVLDGEVLNQAQADALRSAAAAAVGAGSVVDNLRVLGLAPALDGADDKVASAAALLDQFGDATSGDLRLDDTDLTVNVEVTDPVRAGRMDDLLQATTELGLRPGGEITVAEPVLSLQEEIDALQTELDALQDEIRENVVFSRSSSRLGALAGDTLDKVVDAMNRYQRPVVEVGGHTDSRGSSSFNLDLSQRRAEAVVDYLVGQGLAADRLNPVGFGETDPISDDDTDEAYQLNRRVEFTALERF